MSPVWDDERVARGMRAQLDLRRERMRAGERPIGWKIAFGSPAALENLGIEAPLVGFLLESSCLESGASYSLASAIRPALEPEIAVHMGADLPAGSDRAQAIAAISGLGVAIELADLDRPLDDLEAVVATNVFQRAVMLGPVREARAGASMEGIVCRLFRNGVETDVVDDPAAVTGEPVGLVTHVADFLGAAGESLRAGDVIITGSVTPLVWVEPGEQIRFEVTSLGSLEVAFE
jgi:2-keto-4-pentenoate hydratase